MGAIFNNQFLYFNVYISILLPKKIFQFQTVDGRCLASRINLARRVFGDHRRFCRRKKSFKVFAKDFLKIDKTEVGS